MTKKRFCKLRMALMVKVSEWGKENGHAVNWKYAAKMPKPKTKSYAEAWEKLKPLRDLYPEIGQKQR